MIRDREMVVGHQIASFQRLFSSLSLGVPATHTQPNIRQRSNVSHLILEHRYFISIYFPFQLPLFSLIRTPPTRTALLEASLRGVQAEVCQTTAETCGCAFFGMHSHRTPWIRSGGILVSSGIPVSGGFLVSEFDCLNALANTIIHLGTGGNQKRV